MATAPLANPELQIEPLAEVSISELEGLFDEQCEEWLHVLRWDYSGPSRLIRETARNGELSGVGALLDGRLIGFSFYVIEEDRCSIGDIYVSTRWRGIGADRAMAQTVLDLVESKPRIKRVESQCVSVGNELASLPFVERKFRRFERHYMIRSLSSEMAASREQFSELSISGPSPREVSVRAWHDNDFGKAARVVHRSYRGEHDSKINSQYRTEEGCAELLAILTDHIWCGTFLPEASRIAIDRATGTHVGVLIASRLAPGAGHIGQISVLPAYQGRGIGRRMIDATMAELARDGFDAVSLAVTGANQGALHLYESCGFETVHRFPVFYRERR
jgi:ribosomal protein S18 acetylase RimI-like enzyme